MYKADGEGNYYQLTEETDYAAMGTFTNGETILKTIDYTTAASDVVWFYDINGATPNNTEYSGGSYTSINSQLANVTVNAGVYEVTFSVVSKAGNGSNHRNEGISVNGTNVANLSGNANGLRTLEIIVASDESVITAYGNGASNYTDNLDYVIIRKTADLPAKVTATMGTNGFTTFSSAYNLDLANLPAGVKAYTGTLTETTLSFAECTKAVPAATGLLLAGDASTSYDIPVTAEAADAVAGNALIAAVTATSKQSAEDGMYYFVMKAGSDPLAFAPISTTKAVTIPAGKAYVELNTATGVRSLTVTFGDDATGIQTVANVESATENYYNLSGQRVANPAKGLYIVNGKKVIIK